MKLITPKDTTVPVTVQTRTALPPDRAFQPAVDLSLVFKGWGPFPAVREVRNQAGAWDHAGVSRNPILSDGSMAQGPAWRSRRFVVSAGGVIRPISAEQFSGLSDVLIPGQESEFGTTAESVILCSGHR